MREKFLRESRGLTVVNLNKFEIKYIDCTQKSQILIEKCEKSNSAPELQSGTIENNRKLISTPAHTNFFF